MPAPIRLILACLAGILVAMLVIAGVQTVGHLLIPPPAGLAEAQGEALKTLMAQMPVEAYLSVLIAYFLGAEIGAAAAGLISHRPLLSAAVVAAVLLGATAANLALLPHPTWVAIASVVAIIVGSTGGGFTAWALNRAITARRSTAR